MNDNVRTETHYKIAERQYDDDDDDDDDDYNNDDDNIQWILK